MSTRRLSTHHHRTRHAYYDDLHVVTAAAADEKAAGRRTHENEPPPSPAITLFLCASASLRQVFCLKPDRYPVTPRTSRTAIRPLPSEVACRTPRTGRSGSSTAS